MSYVFVQNGQVVAYPYSFVQLRLDNPDVSFPRDPDDAWLAGYGLHRVVPAPRPVDHPSIIISEGQPVEINGAWTQVWDVVDAPLPSKQQLLAYAASKRFEKEVGGIEVGDTVINTDRGSQAMIAGAYNYSQAHPSELIKFKSGSGWISIDVATVAAIATAVGAHVQACFALEESVSAEIEAETVTTYAQVEGAFV